MTLVSFRDIINTIFLLSGCSAVASVRRSGRRGRGFESPQPDYFPVFGVDFLLKYGSFWLQKISQVCRMIMTSDDSGRVPPVPIPNTEVKPLSADGTALVGE